MSLLSNILLLVMVAVPVLGLIALWEYRIKKGEWLEDKDKE